MGTGWNAAFHTADLDIQGRFHPQNRFEDAPFADADEITQGIFFHQYRITSRLKMIFYKN